LLESRHVALGRFLRQSVIGFLRRLGFGCGHVFVLGQATKISILNACSPGFSRVRVFKRVATFSSAFPIDSCEVMWSPSTRV
jgi:hypothetical protein